MLIKLIDGGLLEIESDTWSERGCDTCDYGSSYVNKFEVELTSGKIYIEIDNMYEYAMSEGSMMEIMLKNIEDIKTMNESDFVEWLKVKIEKEVEENYCDKDEVTFNFVIK